MAHIENNVEVFLNRLNRLHFSEPTTAYPSQERYDLEFPGMPSGFANGHTLARHVLEEMAEGELLDIGGPNLTVVRTWESFIFALRTEAGDPQGDPLSGTIFSTFRAEFMLSQGLDPNDPDDLGIFEVLLPAGATSQDREDLLNALFVSAFNHFLQNYDFDFGGEDAEVAFYLAWNEEFLPATNFLEADSISISPPTFGQTGVSGFMTPDLTSYRDLYLAFVPGATQADFENRFVQFFNETFSENGYFIANHFAREWFQVVLQEQLQVSFGSTAVDGTGSEQVRIIFQLFSLLTEMLGILQRVAATQAERLRFYANMQRAYTELITRIPNVTTDAILEMDEDGEVFSGNADDNLNRANQAQQQIQAVTQAYTERLRSFRSVWSDEARSHQTTVNQSNETVNQQANLSTALLQQVSTILQGIFR